MSQKQNPYVGGDARTLEARKRGFPARSVFKLEEIQQKTQLLRPGMRVLDLGAVPGSWSLFASQKIGPTGRVLAVDLSEMEQRFPANVTVVRGDAFDLSDEVLGSMGPYDAVLSDMAPRTSGVKFTDQVASFELFERALAVARALGKPETSSFVCKIFMGPEFNQAIALAKQFYKKSRVIRPAGTRPNSKETFLVGLGLRADAQLKR
jgi:23S rRNA (uridine2552-2'-O)-methyltransferase